MSPTARRRRRSTRLAETLTALARPLEDQLAAIEEGLRCDPLAGDLHDWRALRLAAPPL
ncbi:MAG: hypothetical protein R3F11_11815 [Verrucomicrobiales bacterium]